MFIQRRGAAAPALRARIVAVLVSAAASSVCAQTNPALEQVIVQGFADRELLLDAEADTGSRLGLSNRETPALIEIVTDVQLFERGARTSIEAFNTAPGVTSAQLASSPGVVSMRGFTGGAVSVLFDGSRITTSALTTRNLDVWSFERIEVLKGPASVMYGEGALAGAINLKPKQALLNTQRAAGMASYGSFDQSRAALDVNTPIGERSAIRGLVSHSRNDGYIDDNAFESFGGRLAWRWQPADALTINSSVDYFADDYDVSYWGTPLVPLAVARDASRLVSTTNGLVLDEALAEANFNVVDGVSDANALWWKVQLGWDASDVWNVSLNLDYYDAERRWRNAENVAFNTSTGLLNRGLTRIDHDHSFVALRSVAAADTTLFNRRNRFAIGAEYSDNDFFNPRRFGTASAIDPYGRERGRFVADDPVTYPGAGNRTNFDSQLENVAVFAENAFNITPKWLGTVGLRHDRLALHRRVDDLNLNTRSEFDREYESTSWRAGSVYSVRPNVQLFAQYSSAITPVGSLLLISQTNSRYSLTSGDAIEAGLKTSLLSNRVDLTFAAFRIRQDDILTRDPNNSSITIQGGRQSSRGGEIALSAALTQSLRLDASFSALDAKFDELIEAGGADRAGNTPTNVPERVATLFGSYRSSAWPLTFSIGARYASHIYTNNANTIRVDGYALLDAGVAYAIGPGELSLRGRNLTDELYGEWTGASATQIVLGAPRSFEVTYSARF